MKKANLMRMFGISWESLKNTLTEAVMNSMIIFVFCESDIFILFGSCALNSLRSFSLHNVVAKCLQIGADPNEYIPVSTTSNIQYNH